MCPEERVEVTKEIIILAVEVTNEGIIEKKVVEDIQPSKCSCGM